MRHATRPPSAPSSTRPTSGRAGFHSLDALESRTLLSTAFAYAGLEYHEGSSLPAIVFGQGSRADDGTLTGATNTASLAGGLQTAGIDLASIAFDSDGSMSLAFGNLSSVLGSSGADFRSSAGYPIGYFAGDVPDVTNNTFHGSFSRYFVEQSAGVRRWDALGTNSSDYRSNQFRAVVIRESGAQLVEGFITFTYPAEHNIQTNPLAPTAATITLGDLVLQRTIQSVDADGTLHFATGDLLYISSVRDALAPDGTDGSGGTMASLMYVDPDGGDGVIAVGIGGRRGPTTFNDNRALAGVFRGSVQVDTTYSRAFFGLSADPDAGPATAQVAVTLLADGSYRIYHGSEFGSSSDPVAFATGHWRVMTTYYTFEEFTDIHDGTVQLIDDLSGNAALFQLNGGGSLTARWVITSGNIQDEVMGEISSYNEPWRYSSMTLRQVDLDANGHPQAYMHRKDMYDSWADRWTKIDLIAAAGGSRLTQVFSFGSTQTQYNPVAHVYGINPGAFVVGIDINGHTVAYEHLTNGRWVYKDLTNDLLGGHTLVSDIAAGAMFAHNYRYGVSGLYSNTDQINAPLLTGITDEGHRLLIYPWMNTGTGINQSYWSTIDLTSVLATAGLTEPEMAHDSITTLSTNWGEVAVMGVDSQGHIQTVWTAPNAGWFVDDITPASTPALAGPIFVLPGFGRIDLFAKSTLNNLVHLEVGTQTGWLWSSLDVTQLLSGPTITQNLVGLFRTDQTLMASGGIDSSGGTTLYYAAQSNGALWRYATISDSIAAEQRPVSLSSAEAINDFAFDTNLNTVKGYTRMCVFGKNTQGELVTLTWPTGDIDAWSLINLSATAHVYA